MISQVNADGYVYVADKGDGSVKIGCSAKPHERLKAIQNIFKFKAVNFFVSKKTQRPYQLEKMSHNSVSEKCVGDEFFKMSFDEAVDVVNEQLGFLDIKILNDLNFIDVDKNRADLNVAIDAFCIAWGFRVKERPADVMYTALMDFTCFDNRLLNICSLALSELIGDDYDKSNDFISRDDVEAFMRQAITTGSVKIL